MTGQGHATDFKLMMRQLPPEVNEQDIARLLERLHPDSSLRPSIIYLEPGKIRGEGFIEPARCCLECPLTIDGPGGSDQAIKQTLKLLDGQVMSDSEGNQYRIQAVAAPYPKLPKPDGLLDPRENTLDTDPEYKKFLASLEAAAAAKAAKKAAASAVGALLASVRDKSTPTGTAPAAAPPGRNVIVGDAEASMEPKPVSALVKYLIETRASRAAAAGRRPDGSRLQAARGSVPVSKMRDKPAVAHGTAAVATPHRSQGDKTAAPGGTAVRIMRKPEVARRSDALPSAGPATAAAPSSRPEVPPSKPHHTPSPQKHGVKPQERAPEKQRQQQNHSERSSNKDVPSTLRSDDQPPKKQIIMQRPVQPNAAHASGDSSSPAAPPSQHRRGRYRR